MGSERLTNKAASGSVRIAFAALMASMCFATSVQAAKAEQSFETCGMITSEYITVLQLIKKEFTGKQLEQSLPALSKKGSRRVDELSEAVKKNGLVETFSAVNSEYARCSKTVYKREGKPESSSRENHFYFCAGENKLRYEFLVAATLDADIKEVIRQIPASRKQMVHAIYDLQDDEGTEATFDAIGDELKYCLNGTS